MTTFKKIIDLLVAYFPTLVTILIIPQPMKGEYQYSPANDSQVPKLQFWLPSISLHIWQPLQLPPANIKDRRFVDYGLNFERLGPVVLSVDLILDIGWDRCG